MIATMSVATSLPVLETPHLLLREMALADAPALARFMTQSRYQKYIAHRLRDDLQVKEFVRRQVAAQDDGHRQVYHLAAEEKRSGDVVGEGFIIVHAGKGHEVGWGVHPAMWSMGLGTEIGQALLAMGFEHMRAESIWCKVMTGNDASATVAKRIGMAQTATYSGQPVAPGRLETVQIFNLAATDYFDLPY